MNFENNWIIHEVDPVFPVLYWKFSEETNSQILNTSVWNKAAMITDIDNAVKRLSLILGDRVWVALSGGVDSQAACLLLTRNGIRFTAAIMRMEDNLNAHDVFHAVMFCELNGISYEIFDFKLRPFLHGPLAQYVEKYKCPSPQFTAHFAFFERLIQERNPTSLICGGGQPFRKIDRWMFTSSRSQSAWMTFGEKNNILVIGNFLSWSKDIALPLMFFQPPSNQYIDKVTAFNQAGLNVLPQERKFSGFERIKDEINIPKNDGWAFEKFFRHRFWRIVPEYKSVLVLEKEVDEKLVSDYESFKT